MNEKKGLPKKTTTQMDVLKDQRISFLTM